MFEEKSDPKSEKLFSFHWISKSMKTPNQ
jgi:hypothetical protein